MPVCVGACGRDAADKGEKHMKKGRHDAMMTLPEPCRNTASVMWSKDLLRIPVECRAMHEAEGGTEPLCYLDALFAPSVR